MDEEPRRTAGHTHRLPKVVRVAIVGLAAAVFLALTGVGLLATYVYQQQQYIEGRGVQRDAEQARLQERLRQAQCDLLDQLPAGGLLERPRAKYHCGPGIPLSDLTPQEQAEVDGAAPASTPRPTAAQPTPRPVPGSAPVPDTPHGTSTAPPTRQPSPPPPQPLTSLVCDLAGVCLTIP